MGSEQGSEKHNDEDNDQGSGTLKIQDPLIYTSKNCQAAQINFNIL